MTNRQFKHDFLRKPLATLVFATLLLAVAPSYGQIDLSEIDPFGDDVQQSDSAPGAGTENTVQKTPDEIFNDAKKFAEDGDHAKAIGIYSQLLQLSPGAAPVALERGKSLAALGETNLALESLSQAINYGARYPAIYSEALAERAKLYVESFSYEDALEDVTQAVTSQPGDAEFLFLRGKILNRLAQAPSAFSSTGPLEYYEQAISSLKRCLEIDEDYAEAYAERATAYAATRKFDKAVADFDKAVELDDEDTNLQAKRGYMYLRRADYENQRFDPELSEVISDYQSAVSSFGSYLNVEGGKEPDDFDEAGPEDVKPDQIYLARAAAQMSIAKEQGGDQSSLYRAAIVDCERALEFDPDSVTAVFQKGVAERMVGELEAAVDSFSEALEMSPGFTEARFRRGIVYYYQGDLEAARGEFYDVIAQSEQPDGRAQFWVGVTYAKQGDFEEAVRSYSQSIKVNPNYKPAYNNRGLAYMQMGQYRQAANDFDQLIRRNRKDTVARERRERARQMMRTAYNR